MATATNMLVSLTAEIVSVHVTHNTVAVSDLPALIANVHATLAGLGVPATPIAAEPQPAVSIRASIKPDYIVCLEDGKQMKMLKRHLLVDHQMTRSTTAPNRSCPPTIRWSPRTTPPAVGQRP